MAMAIAHKDPSTERIVIDAIRKVKPQFSPEDAVDEFIALLQSYSIEQVTGDAWGGLFVRQPFAPIEYRLSELNKSAIYRDSLALINSRRPEFLDNVSFVTQICGLERRTGRGGRDSIDHAPGAHDDVANAVCGALLLANAADVRIKWAAVSASGEIYDGSTNHQTIYQPPPNRVETY
jgi:hypothetical protein